MKLSNRKLSILAKESNLLSLDSLYGLRGIAALAIVMFHFVPNVKIPSWALVIPHFFGNAVQLFFCLSAFSLCYTTTSYLNTENWIDKYFWKRFFRIAPPFWAMLFFFTIHDHFTWGLPFFVKSLFSNLLLIFNFIPGIHESSIMAGWTIGVEVIFYALFPLLILLINSLTRAIVFFTLSSIALINGRILLLQVPVPGYAHESFITNLVYFSAGMLAYWIYISHKNLSNDRKFIVIAPIIAGVLLLGFTSASLGNFFQATESYGVYISIVCCFFTTWLALRPEGLFANTFLIWCGKRSYSIYLIHALIVWRLTPVYLIVYKYVTNESLAFLISISIAIFTVLILSAIFHQFIEQPSIAIGRGFEDGRFNLSSLIKIVHEKIMGFSLIKKLNALDRNLALEILTISVFIYALWVAISYSNQPILESYGFRQTQTALTAFWMVREGWQLAYQTPVAGFPWSIPFEFPMYQTLVAYIARFSGLSLIPIGRLVSFAFLIACAWPAFGIVRRIRLPDQVAWIFCALLFSSPLNLFYGRTFMIETSALFFAFAGIPFALDLLNRNAKIGPALTCLVFFSIAALQKVTTGAPVILICSLIYLLVWFGRGRLRAISIQDLLVPALAFIFPILIAYAWVLYGDAIKQENALGAAFSSSQLSKWNYGTLEQKISLSTYVDIVWARCFELNAGGLLGLGLILASLIFGAKRVRATVIAGLAFFVLPILIFTNLHLVHNYYQVGCLLFLIGSLSVSVGAWLPSVVNFRPMVLIMTSLLVMINISNFNSGYGSVAASTIDPASESPQYKALAVGEAVRKYTASDSGIIVLGNDWDSDIAFYSERKSFTVPDSFVKYEQVLAEPANFLGDLELGAIVICQDDKGNMRGDTVDGRVKKFNINQWVEINAGACRLLLPRK